MSNAKCEGGSCPLKFKCERFVRLPDSRVNLFRGVPFERDKCLFFVAKSATSPEALGASVTQPAETV